MDFKQLLQLAGENSAFAKKKADRLGAQNQDDGLNVSSSAVAKYLAKQKQFKEKHKAEEEEARRKRVKARLEASIGKKKVDPKKKLPVKKHTETEIQKNKKDEIKFKVDSTHKKKHSDSNHHTKTKNNNLKLPIKDDKIPKITNDKSITKHKNEHRKEVNRTIKTNTSTDKNRSSKKRKPASAASGSGLSFTELMKLAKMNSENPGMGKDLSKTLKSSVSDVSDDQSSSDSDRSVKTKVKKKDHEKHQYHESRKHYDPTKKGKLKEESTAKQKHKYDNYKQQSSHEKTPKNINKPSKKKQEPIKRGLVMETISTSKNELPMKKHSSSYKQVKSTERHRGIAAQNHFSSNSSKLKNGKIKKSACDVEAQFEKEERALARKRKLFEMRRITGNIDMQEDDLFGEDDYDLDEEDEEDENFIDDSEQAVNVSKHIRSIFGYDKRRFDDSEEEEDDLKNMESNYSQIAKEEARSARIAKIEDDYEKMKEDEQEERIQRKKMKKKI